MLHRVFRAFAFAAGLTVVGCGSSGIDTSGSGGDVTGGMRGGGGGAPGSTGGMLGRGGAGAGGTIAGTGGGVMGRAGTGGTTVANTGGLTGASGGNPGTSACTPGTAPPGAVSVNLCATKQTMDGFGAADTWALPLTAAQNTLFWDPTNGIGLSILRIGIDVNGTPLGSGAYADAKAAYKFGVKVWGAPWSPPAADKSNGDENDGGTLNAGAYTAWANILAGFPATFQKNTGFALYGISAQNEPDFVAPYASCIYSAAQMVAFVKVLGPMLHALSPPVKLLAPESDVWDHLWTTGDKYGPAILADPMASASVDILATHDYGHMLDTLTSRPAPPAGTEQPIWQTEMSDQTAPDLDIGHGIQVATWIYAGIVNGGATAWHYWWLVNANSDGEGLLQKGGSTNTADIPKRLFTLGNFSKFVRPGYQLVTTTGTIPANVLIASFVSPSGQPVVVAINAGLFSANVDVYLSGASGTKSVVPWVTSASTDVRTSATAIAVSNNAFSATLGGQSVTTFVGQ